MRSDLTGTMARYHVGPINTQLSAHRCPRVARTAKQIVARTAKARARRRLILPPSLLKQTPAIAGNKKSRRHNRGSDSSRNRRRQNKQGRKQQMALTTDVRRETDSTVNPAAHAHINNTRTWQRSDMASTGSVEISLSCHPYPK
jgi:hypothetical protein